MGCGGFLVLFSTLAFFNGSRASTTLACIRTRDRDGKPQRSQRAQKGFWGRMAMGNMRVNRRLHSFYDELTSVDTVLRALARDRPEAGTVTAADLYTRSLDCQNHGGFALLEHHAALVTAYRALGERQRVLDAGCGLGGPGRY